MDWVSVVGYINDEAIPFSDPNPRTTAASSTLPIGWMKAMRIDIAQDMLYTSVQSIAYPHDNRGQKL